MSGLEKLVSLLFHVRRSLTWKKEQNITRYRLAVFTTSTKHKKKHAVTLKAVRCIFICFFHMQSPHLSVTLAHIKCIYRNTLGKEIAGNLVCLVFLLFYKELLPFRNRALSNANSFSDIRNNFVQILHLSRCTESCRPFQGSLLEAVRSRRRGQGNMQGGYVKLGHGFGCCDGQESILISIFNISAKDILRAVQLCSIIVTRNASVPMKLSINHGFMDNPCEIDLGLFAY